MKTKGKFILATILILFGLLSLLLTSSVLLDLFEIRAKEGNYVLAVVWANFIAALLYLMAAYAVLKERKWSVTLLLTAVAVLVLGQILLFIHIVNGGLYETKTVGAMIFRIILTVLFTVFAYQLNRKNKNV